jgi:SAM-dependent methyltransferase
MGRPRRHAGDPAGSSVPCDYDTDPGRYRRGMQLADAYTAGSMYDRVARMLLRAPGVAGVLDVGCADGVLARALPREGPYLVGMDTSPVLLRGHPPPAVRGDAARLPFGHGTLDAVTALNVLYHLPSPLPALREAHRVLRDGGYLLVSAIARDDSPELAGYWRRPATTFDAEDAPALLAQVFADVAVHPWDAPLVTLPSPTAIRDYLLGRQAPIEAADAAAHALPVPLRVTKRGALLVARCRQPRAAGPRLTAVSVAVPSLCPVHGRRTSFTTSLGPPTARNRRSGCAPGRRSAWLRRGS